MLKLNIKSKEKIKRDIELLVSSMIKYFKCSEEDIKLTEIKFDDSSYVAAISYNYIDWNIPNKRNFITSTCKYYIEGDYDLKGVFRYEGKFYKFENLSLFFTVISKEMEGLNAK